MNIIKKIVRKFGVDIIRYSNDSAGHSKVEEKEEQVPLISKEEASKILASVGRKSGIPTFTYFERPHKSSLLMEEAENLWWNSHGNLVEKVWVLSDPVNYKYRNDYVSKAAAFFKGDKNTKAKVLDLGCGSGWFGRMIADEHLEYFGMDFSATQIEIANKKKETSLNKDYLNYYCLSDIKQLDNLNEITGVVIHAFLHHLYWEDLDNLFSELGQILPVGCKFFIVEPTYPDPLVKQNGSDVFLKILQDYLANYREYRGKLKRQLIKDGMYDTQTASELNNIVSESDLNGFFLSPKEVPFRIGEFRSFLDKYLEIKNVFACGIINLETAQFIDRITSRELQDHYSELLFPVANTIDRILLNNNYFESDQSNYIFTSFEGVLKKIN
ncbi:MAG TPA: class I SAM-dependent methyltransferase [Bacteroidia bacterium]